MKMPEKRILLVEDEQDVRTVMTHALRGEGYVVDTATTVAEAWWLLDAHSYALAIVDWRLPDGNGMVIADGAAQLGAKTYLMSGYLFWMPGGRAHNHETLMKPLRPGELIALVEGAIGGADATSSPPS